MGDVILVGNGISSGKYEYGDLIDSYDTVVRFNWYQTKGREKYVGSKTDIWFTSFFDPVKVKQNNRIFIHSWHWVKRFCPVWQKFKGKTSPDTELGKTFNRLLWDIRNFRDEERGAIKRITSTGVESQIFSTFCLATWWMLSEGQKKYCDKSRNPPLPAPQKIDLYGVDWWLMGREGYTSDDDLEVSKKQRPKVELDLFRQLHEKGKIKDLNPESDFNKFYE